MIISDEKKLSSTLKNGEIASPILLYGSEEYLKQYYAQRLIKTKEAAFSSFNEVRFTFADMDMHQLADVVTTPPFMAELKTVLVFDVVPKEVSAEQFKQFEEIFSSLYADCRLVMLEKSGAVEDRRDEKSKKLIKLIDKYGTVVQLKERSDAELQKLLRADAGKEGCSFSADALKTLLSRCGRDIAALKSETAKLCAYRMDGEITAADVIALTVELPEDNIYGLGKAILRGDYDGAMRIFGGLMSLRYPSESILGTLSGVFVDLCRAKAASNQGKRAVDVAAEFGYGKRAFVIESALRDQRKWTQDDLCSALDILSEADVKLKSTQLDARILLEETITALFVCASGK